MQRTEYANYLVKALGGKWSGAIDFLVRWMQREGGTATFNPLNTTYREPGSTNYNSIGVQNYDSADEGVKATVSTLHNGYYPHLVEYLVTGDHPDTHALDQEVRRWSGGGYSWHDILNTPDKNAPVAGESGPPSWYHRLLYIHTPLLPKGSDVEHVQSVVGVTVDGWYGPQTAEAVTHWQQTHGLSADGKVGPLTAGKMG